ncbi:MAG: anhydro-N-acetylmuramic acid kinase [Candidatus Sumerlaeaceae bacterium]
MPPLLNSNRIIALMSGTSVDSIDAVLCEIGQRTQERLGAEVLAFHEHPISAALRERIFEAFADGTGSLSLSCSLNFEIGAAFAEAAECLISKAAVKRTSVAAIASHGQTLYHIAPHMAAGAANHSASTLQVGESAVIAERTGLRVVADFRVADMAAGGNGAPLVPFADYHLFSRAGTGVIVHNMGGIANCTYLPASGKLNEVIAFDTGPGNMIMDALVQHFYPGETYDVNGEHAAAGTVLEDLLCDWMALPYINAPPPKSTGRELFGVQFAQRALQEHGRAAANDLIATANAFTARSFAQNLQQFVLPGGAVAEILLGGGGALNLNLKSRITDEIRLVSPATRVACLDETGISSKERECVAFALLGYARLHNIPANVPSATGAKHPALLGKISDPPPRTNG